MMAPQSKLEGIFKEMKIDIGRDVRKLRFQNHKNGPAWGRGGSVWAETLSKRRPEAQDHFPSPPGPKNQIRKSKIQKMMKIQIFSHSKSSTI